MEEINAFKKDDYIVLLKNKYNSITGTFPINYCYKQRERYSYIRPFLDNENRTNNGQGANPANKSKNNDWRYATEREIRAYNKAGKPIDITKIKEESYGVY